MAFPLAILAALAGTALQGINASQAARRQKAAARRALENTEKFNRQAEGRLQDSLRDFDAGARETREGGREAENQRLLEDALTTDREPVLGDTAAGFRGRVSDDFVQDRAKRTEERLANSLDLAKRAAAFQASGFQRGQDDVSILGALDADLGTIRRNQQGRSLVDQMAIEEAGRRNLGLDIIGAILQGAGTAGALSGGGGGPRTIIQGGDVGLLPPLPAF